MKPLINENGITVTELKEWLEQFPQDINGLGEENGVWVQICKGLSSEVTELWRLNSTDVLLVTRGGNK